MSDSYSLVTTYKLIDSARTDLLQVTVVVRLTMFSKDTLSLTVSLVGGSSGPGQICDLVLDHHVPVLQLFSLGMVNK